jgi:hypothetical protein
MPKDKKKRLSKEDQTENQIASALVILRSHSGKRVRPEVPITSENIAEYTPSPQDVAAARDVFRAAGFEVGEMVGISFTITAPLTRFEQYFGTRLRIDQRGAVALVGADAPVGGLELPLDRLPATLTDRVIAVTFSPPAELTNTA